MLESALGSIINNKKKKINILTHQHLHFQNLCISFIYTETNYTNTCNTKPIIDFFEISIWGKANRVCFLIAPHTI